MKTKISSILALNIAGLALFSSWYLRHTHGFWLLLDSAVFHFFNHAVSDNHVWVWFLAITNNRAFDACSLLAMGGLILAYWLKETPAGQRRIFIIGVVMLLSAIIINQLAQHLMPVKRASPSLSFDDAYRVSEMLSVPTKDASEDSFPGDHGMMLLIFTSFMWRYFGLRAFYLSLIIFVVFAFPRIMIGAHWFTDIAVGSMTAVLIGMPWILLTPLSDRLILRLDRSLPILRNKK